MQPTPTSSRSFWLILLALTIVASLLALRASYARWQELGVDLTRSVWGLVWAVYVLALLLAAWLFLQTLFPGRLPMRSPAILNMFDADSRALRLLGGVIFLAILLLIPYVKFTFNIGRDERNLLDVDSGLLSAFYYWSCWYALLLAMAALKIAFRTTWQIGFVSAMVILGVAYEVLLRFNAVTTYPLSMGWSEGSRYYYASLYFSRELYGESVPLSTLHPTRYWLQSLPFLFPGLEISAHRFWQFLLWIGLTASATIVLSRRAFPAQEQAAKWLFAGWLFLFFLRVGVYYHLQVVVILPLLFVRTGYPWRSLAAVVLASAWAGLSRVNWFPVPAMLAIAIYLLETPLRSDGSARVSGEQILTYFRQPLVWAVAGLLTALAVQAAYIFLSGNAENVDAFASSFTSDLLWYRLWPNPNHFLGVLPAILIVSGPLLIVLLLAARRGNTVHAMRWTGLLLMLGVLFAGSLVVSVKIGGGGDLHNMDAYAILTAVIAAYFIGGRTVPEPGETSPPVRPWTAFAVAALIPILFLIPLLSPYPDYDENRNAAAYRQLVEAVKERAAAGPVLFINERQLVTFRDVEVPLVSDYEAVTLMEMAMANNRTYLDRFYHDLKSHRFAAIVAVKQNVAIKDSGPLAEENNVWNSRVSPYILCYYQPMTLIEPQGNRIEVFVPASAATNAACPQD